MSVWFLTSVFLFSIVIPTICGLVVEWRARE